MKYILALLLISSSATAVGVCKQETKDSFEKHLSDKKFQIDASCQIFYHDIKKHTACWTDGKQGVVPTTSVTCKE